MLSVVVTNALINALAGLAMVFVFGIGVEMLTDGNTNVFAAAITVLEFAVTTPLE